MDEYRLDDFDGAVGEDFEVAAGDATLSLKLKGAEAIPSHSLREHGSFSLYWRGPFEPILPQATYEFRRDGKAYSIFIVPIDRDDDGTTYEAVFN